MDWWEAMILGLVEGLTEYLPVSSTGHLILAQRAMGIPQSDQADAYAICIQAGAIVAVLGLYWGRVKQMGRGLVGRDVEGRRLLVNVVAAFVPAMVFGLLLNKTIKANLFGLWPVVAAWFVGGVAILLVAWWKAREARGGASAGLGVGGGVEGAGEVRALPGIGVRKGLEIEQLTWKLALVIGLVQCLAMWPGTSRSLVTIVAGLLVGMRVAAAVEFSFLLGVLTLGAATCYDGMKHGDTMIEHYGPVALATGFLFAFISAVVAIKWMVAYLQRHGLAVFGWYRVTMAVVVGAMIVGGMLKS